MDIYNYDQITGEYLNKSVADPNPEEPGQFLMPAFSVKTKPPEAGEHEIAVRRAGKWDKQPDYRGTQYWLPDGTEYEITEIGKTVPTGAATTPSPGEFYIVKDGKWVIDQTAFDAAQRARNKAQKSDLLAHATQQIGAYQDAVDLDMATADEAAALIAWKKYRVLLNRVNVAGDVEWPVAP